MNDFLNPKSMITPGMAGALVMFLSNSICFQFPEIAPRWAALALSFVLGGFVVAAARLRFVQASGFWLINSLIIFAVAAGSAGVASRASGPIANNAAAVLSHLVSTANAQPVTAATPAVAKPSSASEADLRTQLVAANARIAEQQRQLDSLAKVAKAVEPPTGKQARDPGKQAKRFFKEW